MMRERGGCRKVCHIGLIVDSLGIKIESFKDEAMISGFKIRNLNTVCLNCRLIAPVPSGLPSCSLC